MPRPLDLYATPLLLFALLGCGAASASEATGSLTIRVCDGANAPVGGASVKAVCIRDSRETSGRTDAQGLCKLTLPAGAYGLTVRAPGFKPDFIGGAVVRAETDFSIRFALNPGDPSEKLPHEKTPAERAAELAKAQKKSTDVGDVTPNRVIEKTLAGLDEACKACKIERTNGGPAARAAYVTQAIKALQERNQPAALEAYKKALGEDASDSVSWFNCGVLFSVERQSRPSEICYRTAIGLCGGGGDARYHANLGRALSAQGHMEKAEASFKAAILIDPTQEGQFTFELGCGFHQHQDFKKAVVLFTAAIEKGCPDPQVHFTLGNALEMLKRGPEALKQYELFLEKGAADKQLEFYIQRTKEKIERLKKSGIRSP